MIDLVGQKFGRLIVIKRTNNDIHGNTRWICQCNCGQKKIIHRRDLRNGDTKSCGCLRKDIMIQRSTKHNHAKINQLSKTYIVWANMIQRCTNPNNKKYHIYGNRGINICRQWIDSFENFLKDMGEVPTGYQIDRIDNNKGYYKKNCRWATSKQNNRNKRSNIFITYGGKTRLLAEWAEKININKHTLWYRIFKYKWSIKRALTIPNRKQKE